MARLQPLLLAQKNGMSLCELEESMKTGPELERERAAWLQKLFESQEELLNGPDGQFAREALRDFRRRFGRRLAEPLILHERTATPR